jgi:hypothetical protein
MEPRIPSSAGVAAAGLRPVDFAQGRLQPDGGGVRRSASLLRGGQGKQEPGAVIQLALGADGPAVRQHDVFGDG